MSFEPVKFLIVDDLDENLLAIEGLLRRETLVLLTARSGPEALELLLVHEVALAIVDVQMPEMDGYELAELMRGTERTRRIPIIFVTAGSIDEHHRFRGYEAGAVDFLFKPIDPYILRNKAEIFYELYKQRQEVIRQRDELSAVAEENLRLLNEARRITLELGESEARFRTLADNIPQLAWMTDETGSIVWYNWRWYDYTGATFEEMQGWGWRSVQHPNYLEAVEEKFRRHILTGEPWEDTFPLRGKDGEYRWFLSRAFPIEDSCGNITRWFGTNTDVTETREVERRAVFLADISECIRDIHNAGDIIARVVQLTGRFLNVDRCACMEINLETDNITIYPDYRLDGLESITGTVSTSIFSPDILGEFVSGNVVEDHAFASHTLHTPATDKAAINTGTINTYVAVPIVRGPWSISLIAAYSSTPRRWKREEKELLRTVIERTWLAVEAARRERLAKDLAAEREEMLAQQSRIAETLQHSLLLIPPPDAYPGLTVTPLYQAAWNEAMIGGDFFDIFAVSENLIALVVGDNTGKGVQAATYTAEIKFALRMALRIEGGAAKALTRLNDFIVQNDRLDAAHIGASYVALSIAIIDTKTGEIICASAGAEPPIIVRASNGETEEVAGAGLLLGITENVDFIEHRSYLCEGDILALVTDGITEARKPKSARIGADFFFGLDGLARCLCDTQQNPEITLPEVCQVVLDKTYAWSGGVQQDDICLILARRISLADPMSGVIVCSMDTSQEPVG